MAAHVPQRPGVVRLSADHPQRRWPPWLPALCWLLLLATLPWWLGLPLLLVCVAALLWRPAAWPLTQPVWRRALRWGLPGMLLAVLRAAGVDALGWLTTLLAALAGFSLLVLLENWLDRARSRAAAQAASTAASTAEWPQLALAPVAPPATIIELDPVVWHELRDGALTDPLGGTLAWQGDALQLPDGGSVAGVEPRCAHAADGRWLALPLARQRGVLLIDRQRGRRHRLRGWQLAGWHAGRPWLARDEEHAPLDIAHVLGRDADD